MKQLIFCTGLPASGKTSWALEQIAKDPTGTGTVRVNKDNIRKELAKGGWTWSREREQDVVRVRDREIRMAFISGANTVISDDTNFGKKHRKRLEQLAYEAGAEFVVKTFDTSVEECIRRDSERSVSIGAEVIKKMADENGIMWPIERYTPDRTKRNAIICDLDGTISLFMEKGHRGPYEAEKADQDEVNLPIRRLLETYYRFMHYEIVYLSARDETYRPQTEKFLRVNHCPPGPLYMRPATDWRKDWMIKRDLFDAHVRHTYNVDFVLDDRNQVVEFWRKMGLTCLQVADGAY